MQVVQSMVEVYLKGILRILSRVGVGEETITHTLSNGTVNYSYAISDSSIVFPFAIPETR